MEISKLNEITQSSNLDFIVQKALDYSFNTIRYFEIYRSN